MYDYAVIHEIVSQDKRDMVRYVDISKAGNPNAYNRKPFTKKEIDILWKNKDSNIYVTVILILIYSGVRIGELLDLEKKNLSTTDTDRMTRDTPAFHSSPKKRLTKGSSKKLSVTKGRV